MTKYNKTAFTLTTLREAHKFAIKQYLEAINKDDKCAEDRWHQECLRLEREVADMKFADGQNEAMRTTDMKQPPAEPLDAEDMWFKDGVVFARTHSCGCCSEIMSSDPEDYDYHEHMTDLDRMAAWVEQQEAKVQALRENFNEYCNSQENG
jgi:hypothetical protein